MSKPKVTEDQIQAEVARIRDREKVQKECGPVPLDVTKQVAYGFSSGVDWGGSSKGLIFQSMSTTKPQGYFRDWEGFRAAMLRVAEIIKRHNTEVYREVECVIVSVKDDSKKEKEAVEKKKVADTKPPEKVEMGKLPPPDSRVFITDNWAGLYSKQVCVVPDATNEEILAACNAEDNAILPGSGKWDIVIRTEADAELAKVEFCPPGTCVECPPRVHMVVRSTKL